MGVGQQPTGPAHKPAEPSTYCGGVKWSAPENSPDLEHAEHILTVWAGFGQ